MGRFQPRRKAKRPYTLSTLFASDGWHCSRWTSGTRPGKGLYPQVLSEAICLLEFQNQFWLPQATWNWAVNPPVWVPVPKSQALPCCPWLVCLRQVYSPYVTGRNKNHPSAFRKKEKASRDMGYFTQKFQLNNSMCWGRVCRRINSSFKPRARISHQISRPLWEIPWG